MLVAKSVSRLYREIFLWYFIRILQWKANIHPRLNREWGVVLVKAKTGLTAFLVIAFLLAGCSEKPSESQVERSLKSDVYYPLIPKTMTYSYTEKSSDGYKLKANGTITVKIEQSRILDDIEVIPVVTTDRDDPRQRTNFIQNTSDGVFLIGTQYGNLPFKKLDQKLPVFKNPIKEGVLFDPYPMDNQHIGSESIDEVNAIITVPYGKFSKCVRKHFLNRSLLSGEVFFERTDWYAPAVGLAKRITKQQVGTKGKMTLIETEMLLKKIDQ
jgi:hypothetical protein